MSTATDDLATAALALTEAMRATCSDPLDAVRILTAFVVATAAADTASPAQLLTANLFRRSAMMSIALATASYQPGCSNDATNMINQVSTLLDAEAVTAADAGEYATYSALTSLRYAVIADLTARSAGLPDLITVKVPGLLPSLVLAYRLYQDTTREPGLVARAVVIHPGFMPASFEALAS